MSELINKLAIFILCLILLPFPSNQLSTVTACVIAIAITCLIIYSKKQWQAISLIGVYCLLCFIFPVYSVFLPLILYDASKYKSYGKAPLIFIGLTYAYCFWGIDIRSCFCLVIFSVVSFLIQVYSSRVKEQLTQFHQFRDESTETSLYLKEKNKALIVRQDYEVHLATLAERNRIAREIHDNVGHMLTRSILQTGALNVINKDETLKQPLDDLSTTLNTAMTSIRNSVHDLHDEAINLNIALQEIIDSITSPEVTLDYDMGSDIPRDIKYAFISIIKEAINNVQKHSNADRVDIIVKEHPALYQLLIQDNGTFSGKIDETGIGLSNMRERVESLGGNINLSNTNGFRIFISIMKKN